MSIQGLARKSVLAGGIAAGALLTGCASIVSGTTQIVSVDTSLGGQPVDGVKCTLTNTKGTFYVTTPGTVPVHRDYGDLAVACTKDALPTGTATVRSSVKGMAAGNILVGGVIGAAVDASSGAAYDYPDVLHVLMGESVALGAPPMEKGAPHNGSLSAYTQQGRLPKAPHVARAPAHAPDTAATATVAATAPPVPDAPAIPPEPWEAHLTCGERIAMNDGKLYNAKFAMEMRGNAVNLHRQGDWGAELMSGDIRNGELILTGNGFVKDNSKRPWNFALRGDMPAGATTYLGKGAMLSNGKITRQCQLSAVRATAAKAVAATVAAASAESAAPAM